MEPPSPGRPGSITSLLGDGSIRIGDTASDWREAVRRAGSALAADGAVTDAYTDEMIATVEELGPYIVIAPGIALAHSRPSPSVRRAALSLVTLASPVEFGHRTNDPVHLVIGLAAPDSEGHVEALAALAELLVDDVRRASLMTATDPATVRALIADWELETGHAGPGDEATSGGRGSAGAGSAPAALPGDTRA
jgi:PTS system ascorbate-specific IIA component